MNYTIRKVKKNEQDNVLELYHSIVGTKGCTWDLKYPAMENIIKDIENESLFGIYDNNNIIAVACGGRKVEGDYTSTLNIYRCGNVSRIGVNPKYQGKGIGLLMLYWIVIISIMRNFDGIRMLVSKDNTYARKMYEKMGFKIFDEVYKYDIDFYCYEKQFSDDEIRIVNRFNKFINNASELNSKFNIDPLLYGSLGLELLLIESLNSDDIDILIPEIFLKDKWEEFKSSLENNGYELTDLKEHTFKKDNILYAYASIENLKEFANIDVTDIDNITFEEVSFKLLNLNQYLEVYQKSVQDGYRINKKNKQDYKKIEIIKKHL